MHSSWDLKFIPVLFLDEVWEFLCHFLSSLILLLLFFTFNILARVNIYVNVSIFIFMTSNKSFYVLCHSPFTVPMHYACIPIYSYILQFDLLKCTATPHKLYNLGKFGEHTIKAVCPLQLAIYFRIFK